jgi:hypothetical protein
MRVTKMSEGDEDDDGSDSLFGDPFASTSDGELTRLADESEDENEDSDDEQ